MPRSDSPVGGTQVSFSELIERLHASGTFEIDVLDTSRRAPNRPAPRRALDDSAALATTLLGIAARAPHCDAVMFNASTGATILAGPLIALVCSALRKPLAIRVFGGNFDLALARLSRTRRAMVERTVCGAELVLLQTQALCQALGERNNARWLATTRDLPRAERPVAARCERFLFLAQLRPEKGFAEAIFAIDRAPRGCTLTVAGPPMATTDVRALGSSQRVRYVGSVDPRNVPRLLAEHDALVFPSRHEGEGLPGAVIEALQCGLPVIATRWRSLPELVTHERNGLLVEPGSVDELGAAIARLAQDRALYAQLAAGALEVGERFRAGPWHARLEAWLLELCGRAPETDAATSNRRRARRVANSR
jgi:glycosyltransferase involved in cell wall biosynthesis